MNPLAFFLHPIQHKISARPTARASVAKRNMTVVKVYVVLVQGKSFEGLRASVLKKMIPAKHPQRKALRIS